MQVSVFGFFTRIVLVIGALVPLLFLERARAIGPEAFGLREGDLIRAVNDPDIYIVNEHGYKRLFLNPVIFGFYGHLKWENVKEVSPQTRDAFTTSGYFRNCKNNDAKVYAVEVTAEDSGVFHWLNMRGETALTEDVDFSKKVFCINRAESAWYARSGEYTSTLQAPKYDRIKKIAQVQPTPTPAPILSVSKNPFYGSQVPCKSNPNPIFQTGLAALSDIEYIVPPGSPSGDKIASHTYLKVTGNGKIPLYAPADSTLIDGSFSMDYGLTLQISCELIYVLGHFTDPVQKIKDAIASGKNPILMEVKAGELLGHTSGTKEVNAFDFGLYHIDQSNNFVNKTRYTLDVGWFKDHNAVCPYDYFVDSLKTGYYAKFATLGGKLVPGASCRSASQDVTGSISGTWFETSGGSNVGPERLIIGTELDNGTIRIGATNPPGFRFPFIFSNNATFKKPSEATREHCYSYSYANDNQIGYFKVISNTEMDAYFSSATSTCPSAMPPGAKRYYR